MNKSASKNKAASKAPASSANKTQDSSFKIISENRKARFNYHIIESFEAGIVLTGAEIKSIRNTGVSIGESYIRPNGSELVLIGAHINPYSHAIDTSYDPVRQRKLLLHRREINKLIASTERKGMTIVPLKVYLKGGRAKVEIALAKGKDAPDKRQTIKGREANREAARAVKGKLR